MTAKDLIAHLVPVVQPDTPAAQAIRLLHEGGYVLLPVVEDGELLGLVNQAMLKQLGADEPVIDALPEDEVESLYPGESLPEVVRKMNARHLPLMPVVDPDEGLYQGAVTHQTIVQALEGVFAQQEPAGTIVLEVKKSEYSLMELIQIIEMESGRLLHLYIDAPQGEEYIRVHLTVTINNLRAIISGMERYGYNLLQVLADEEHVFDARSNFDGLMRYLNV